MEERVFIGLGSNLGQRAARLQSAIEGLVNEGVKVRRVSSIYETPPWGHLEQPSFLNQVIEVAYVGSPEELLAMAMGLESALGRKRTVHWGPRTIDIDILAFGDRVVTSQRLVVPHPMLADRAFVLVPWSEIAPDFVVPSLNKSVMELLGALPLSDKASISSYRNE